MAEEKSWVTADDDSWSGNGQFSLAAAITPVAKALAKLLKPGRTMITAVQFTDGKMEEIRETVNEGEPFRELGVVKTPKAAVTVAAPVRGCPAPDFTQAEIKAQDVLRTFLAPDQIADFNRYNKFISIGATTGNRYMITSRHATDELSQYTRSLYDLERKVPLCVHDWDVPASEEMLTLHVLLQLPGWESYLQVTEDNMEHVLEMHMRERDLPAVKPHFVEH